MSLSWPIDEARRLQHRWDGAEIIFQTGYGPSGLPHIGTFTEVLRTIMVQNAFRAIDDRPTRLIVFSDDMDALRKVPDNVPNREMLDRYVGVSLSRVPDPFGCCQSFAHHNNAQLCEFLDRFGFDYEFRSATDFYTSGFFDETLLRMLDNLDAINDIIKPTLGEERRATYCPFMPILPDGRVITEGYLGHNVDLGTVNFLIDGREWVFPVTGGRCKLQWKADWAMRWMAFGVDYEMSGKDLIDSVNLSGKIVKALGHRPPNGFTYEMFLDEEGRKISKSVGNGLTIDEWLRYGPPESLAFYLYREPRKAKKLYPGLIPRAIDEYWLARASYAEQTEQQRLANPVHHIHNGEVPSETLPVTFSLLLNLIGILGDVDADMVWGYVLNNYAEDAPEALRALIPYALAYHRDHVASGLVRRSPSPSEGEAMSRLCDALLELPAGASAVDIQAVVYSVGKDTGYADDLRGWFRVFYEVLFGAPEGPRLGAFIDIYGIEAFVDLVRDNIAEA